VGCPICASVELVAGSEIVTHDFSFKTCGNKFTYATCVCGLTYLRNRPVASALDVIYPSDYSGYIQRTGAVASVRRRNFKAKFTDARDLLSRPIENLKVLDFGCGNGEFLGAVLHLGDSARVSSLVGFDFTLAAVPGDLVSRAIFCDSSLEALSRGPFDLVFMNQVIEHLPSPLNTLRAIRDAMNTGGVLSIETPSLSGLDYRLQPRSQWGGWHAPRHFALFDETSLRAIVEKAGFLVESFEYIPSPFLWAETLRVRTSCSVFKKFLNIQNLFYLLAVAPPEMIAIRLGYRSSNMKIRAVAK
jgi:SAM-dependent methyltransferase